MVYAPVPLSLQDSGDSIPEKQFAVGIDLHGTLLDDRWAIRSDLMDPLIGAMDSVLDICNIYVCSGNDLTFIEKYVPTDVRKRFKGYILETGCVLSDGFEEAILVHADDVEDIKKLEKALWREGIPNVRYFARRLATVSMFTRDEKEGTRPEEIFERVKELVRHIGYARKVYVTHSNVAVDIIPVGYDKFTALDYAAKGLGTIGIADSLNDSHLILNATYGFVPRNASPALLQLIGGEGRQTAVMSSSDPTPGEIRISDRESTECVIEVLRYIDENLRH